MMAAYVAYCEDLILTLANHIAGAVGAEVRLVVEPPGVYAFEVRNEAGKSTTLADTAESLIQYLTGQAPATITSEDPPVTERHSDFDLLTEHDVLDLVFGGFGGICMNDAVDRLPPPDLTIDTSGPDGPAVRLWRRNHLEWWLDGLVSATEAADLARFERDRFVELHEHRSGPRPQPRSLPAGLSRTSDGLPPRREWSRRDVLAWARDGYNTRDTWPPADQGEADR